MMQRPFYINTTVVHILYLNSCVISMNVVKEWGNSDNFHFLFKLLIHPNLDNCLWPILYLYFYCGTFHNHVPNLILEISSTPPTGKMSKRHLSTMHSKFFYKKEHNISYLDLYLILKNVLLQVKYHEHALIYFVEGSWIFFFMGGRNCLKFLKCRIVLNVNTVLYSSMPSMDFFRQEIFWEKLWIDWLVRWWRDLCRGWVGSWLLHKY